MAIKIFKGTSLRLMAIKIFKGTSLRLMAIKIFKGAAPAPIHGKRHLPFYQDDS